MIELLRTVVYTAVMQYIPEPFLLDGGCSSQFHTWIYRTICSATVSVISYMSESKT